jgi:hypothetical protein
VCVRGGVWAPIRTCPVDTVGQVSGWMGVCVRGRAPIRTCPIDTVGRGVGGWVCVGGRSGGPDTEAQWGR